MLSTVSRALIVAALLATATGAEPGANAATMLPAVGARTNRDKQIIAHAVLMSLAFTMFMPLAALLGRFGRRFPWWTKAHAALQLFSTVLVVAGFVLGIRSVGRKGFQDSHQRLGAILSILVLLQAIGGAFAHRSKGSEHGEHVKGKSPIRWAHIVSGVTIIVIGWVEIGYLGFDEWAQKSDAQTKVSKAVVGVFWAVCGVMGVAWLGGCALVFATTSTGRRSSIMEEK